MSNDRNQLLEDICNAKVKAKLRPTKTNDRSAPILQAQGEKIKAVQWNVNLNTENSETPPVNETIPKTSTDVSAIPPPPVPPPPPPLALFTNNSSTKTVNNSATKKDPTISSAVQPTISSSTQKQPPVHSVAVSTPDRSALFDEIKNGCFKLRKVAIKVASGGSEASDSISPSSHATLNGENVNNEQGGPKSRDDQGKMKLHSTPVNQFGSKVSPRKISPASSHSSTKSTDSKTEAPKFGLEKLMNKSQNFILPDSKIINLDLKGNTGLKKFHSISPSKSPVEEIMVNKPAKIEEKSADFLSPPNIQKFINLSPGKISTSSNPPKLVTLQPKNNIESKPISPSKSAAEETVVDKPENVEEKSADRLSPPDIRKFINQSPGNISTNGSPPKLVTFQPKNSIENKPGPILPSKFAPNNISPDSAADQSKVKARAAISHMILQKMNEGQEKVDQRVPKPNNIFGVKSSKNFPEIRQEANHKNPQSNANKFAKNMQISNESSASPEFGNTNGNALSPHNGSGPKLFTPTVFSVKNNFENIAKMNSAETCQKNEKIKVNGLSPEGNNGNPKWERQVSQNENDAKKSPEAHEDVSWKRKSLVRHDSDPCMATFSAKNDTQHQKLLPSVGKLRSQFESQNDQQQQIEPKMSPPKFSMVNPSVIENHQNKQLKNGNFGGPNCQNQDLYTAKPVFIRGNQYHTMKNVKSKVHENGTSPKYGPPSVNPAFINTWRVKKDSLPQNTTFDGKVSKALEEIYSKKLNNNFESRKDSDEEEQINGSHVIMNNNKKLVAGTNDDNAVAFMLKKPFEEYKQFQFQIDLHSSDGNTIRLEKRSNQ